MRILSDETKFRDIYTKETRGIIRVEIFEMRLVNQ